MNDFYYLITITERYMYDEALDFFTDKGIQPLFSSLCRGTAQQQYLDLLGIEQTEKVMFSGIITKKERKPLLRALLYEYKIDLPGNGIALTIPLSGIGRKRSLPVLLGDRADSVDLESHESETPKKEGKDMFSLIVCIVESGYTDLVMDGARAAGAKGGTVVHAKGTAKGEMNKFFGIQIGSEKEMIFIVANDENHASIMKAIAESAGPDTGANAVLFSLPVEDVIGLRGLIHDDL